MNRLNNGKFGLAFGLTWAILYLACMALMFSVGQEGTIAFFNTLLHGLDITSVIRMDIPFGESLLGVIQSFVLGWITGALIAGIYNKLL